MDSETILELMKNPEKVLFEFKEWDNDTREEYIEFFYKNHPHPNSSFDGNGFRYDIHYLNKLGNDLILCPVEFISNYVDVITKDYVDKQDKVFAKNIASEMEFYREEFFLELNATAIGNLGYFYLFTSDETAKEIVKSKLLEIFIWKFNKYKKFLEALNSIN